MNLFKLYRDPVLLGLHNDQCGICHLNQWVEEKSARNAEILSCFPPFFLWSGPLGGKTKKVLSSGGEYSQWFQIKVKNRIRCNIGLNDDLMYQRQGNRVGGGRQIFFSLPLLGVANFLFTLRPVKYKY